MSLSLLDWRRRVTSLYVEVRATSNPEAAHELWRVTRNELLTTHPDSPVPAAVRSDYPGAPVAPYDGSLRFELDVDHDVEPGRLGVETGTDGVVVFDRIGRLHLPALGDLDVWWIAGYGGGMFVPIKDATAGSLTYGGGRYLLDTVKGADLGGDRSSLIVDLNFAYNPSCAYDPAWACPLAPPGNTVDLPVHAGELTV